MASLIPGYDYDIFVSYRKKDNKYDGWVTEFVDNLRKELEATFKEQVTVYFDENTFDGIQEIHNVNLSLGQKLKSLVFVPIVSQTYCDPQSFAWKNELLVFRKMASEDEFGLQIALPNGNVASRIVPVRIHELDEADRSLLERELGGPLRSIDFIYSSPGVNRPLRSNEEDFQENARKTSYRNQINKTANLLKDLIQSMRAPQRSRTVAGHRPASIPGAAPGRKRGLVVVGVILLVLLAGFLYSDWIMSAFSSDGDVAVTLAVLPFKVIGNEEGQYLADGVADVLLSNLVLFPGLKVKARTSVEKYRNSQLSVGEIATDLDVLYVLEGSTQKFDNNIRIIVKLFDAATEEGIWSQTFDAKFENILQVQSQISEVIAKSLKAKLTPDISEKLSKMPTENFEAYDLFLRSRQSARQYEATGDIAHLEMAKSLLRKSLKIDPGFAKAYAWLATMQAMSIDESGEGNAQRDSVYLLATHAIQLDSSVVEANLVLSEMYDFERDDGNALRYTYKALQDKALDSASSVRLVIRLAEIYSRLGFEDRAISLLDMLTAVTPDNPEIQHLKFYPLASSGRMNDLDALPGKIRSIAPGDEFAVAVELYQMLRKKDYDGVLALYNIVKGYSEEQLRTFDQQAVALAMVLKSRGKVKEADKLVSKWAELFAGNEYLQAQVAIYNGRDDQGLQMLSGENVGTFNLDFCEINPVFDRVRGDERFLDFIDRNKSRIENERDRIIEHEGRGFLPAPEDFFAPVSPPDLGSS